MAENSGIEWTDHTFNPWIGCTKISPACDHCYAEELATRFKMVKWGEDRKRTSEGNWGRVRAWDRKAEKVGVRARVFVASLADVFDNHRSIEQTWRDDLWQLIRDCQNLDFLLLTKRPQNIRKFLPADWYGGYPNVWLGATVENQEEANRRIPALLLIPAKIHFLSCEPLLGPLDLTFIEREDQFELNALTGFDADICLPFRAIDWVICGGESAPDDRRRDMDIEWARSLRDQCDTAGVPFFFKQYSGRDQKAIKALGRELDGVVHDAYPEVRNA